MNPKVSIVIPVYNGSNYLPQAIDSALAQNYNNFEVILINDGSKDDKKSEQIALSYGDKILYYFQENKGVASAWNKGVSLATGKYISFLSHDDLYTPDKISSQIQLINDFNDINTIIYSNWAIIDENNNKIQDINLPNLTNNKIYLYYLINRSMHGCSLLIHKDLIIKEDFFNETLISTCDYDFIFRTAKYANYILCPKLLVLGRKHKDQYTYVTTKHDYEKELLFIKYNSFISKNLLNSSFDINNQIKYLFNLFNIMLASKYNTAALYFLKQINIIFKDNPTYLKEILFLLTNSISTFLK
jgi:glycosyltransferase involved in cell wall biosynthesis